MARVAAAVVTVERLEERTVLSALAGTFSVGASGDYASLTAAMADIQTQSLGGAVVLELQASYSSASETFPLVFSNLGTTATNTLTVRPEAGATGLVISSSVDFTAATVDLNGAQFVTFDGRPGGTGTAKELTIENTDTSGSAVRFINEASNNTLKFVTLRGVNISFGSGTVLFSTTTGANGNDNNTIDTCDIRDGASTPANGIYSRGTTTTTAQNNSGNTVTNCNVFNFVASIGSDAAGVRLDGGNTDWTISGNSFYQTASRAGVGNAIAPGEVRAIFVNNTSGNNFTVTGNFIGGDSPGAAVTTQKWTTTGTTAEYLFQGIRLNVGTTTPSSVQGNTIANIVWTSSSNSSHPGGPLPGVWSGIFVEKGNVNIGTVTGNTIGSGTGTGSISVTTSGTGGTSIGIGIGFGAAPSSDTVAIANNTIGSITTNGADTSGNPTTSVSASLVGIQVNRGVHTISNNTVGSTTTANSLNAATSSTSATAQQVTGIVVSNPSTSASITGNTVANLNNNYAGIGAGQIRGIVTSAGVNTITGNTVRNLSTTSQNANTTIAQSVFGIAATSVTAGQTVSQNTVHSLANTAASANVSVTGIYFAAGASSGHVIARNFVHSLAVSSTSATSVVNGMQFVLGSFTAQNNLVRVGLDATGASTAGASIVRGIYDNGTTAGRNFYHNSVFVGGTQTSLAANTFAFQSTGVSNARTFQNNLFVNARSNSGGTGKHYAVQYGGTTVNPTGLTAGGNLFLASGTGGVLGLFNSVDRTTLADWQTATGVDTTSLNTDPLFVLPTGTAATVNLHLQSTSPALGAGLDLAAVTNDFDGDLRPLTTPDIGADEFSVPPNAAPEFTSSATPSVPENTLDVVALTATDADLDTVTFSITGGADSDKFEIVDVSGSPVLKFKTANTPNFENPFSAAFSNTYLVTVTADDGQGHSTGQDLTVTVANANDAPFIEAVGVSRQQGSPATRSAIAYVFDEDGGDGDITVTVTSANPSNGVTISNIVNTNGEITADVIAESTATDASFTLQASDGSLISTTTLNVTVTANTPPTLGYEPRAFLNKTLLDGLSGDQVNAVVVAGNTIYVGTGSNENNGGLSISTDGGQTFVNRTTADGLGANTVIDIAVNGSTVVVAHRFTGVFGYSISTDGGATFTYINGGSFFFSIAESNGTIYGGSNGVGLKITSDGGNSFVTRTTADGLGNGVVRDLFVTGNTVYAATAGGLSISTDGGTTFVNRTTADGLGNNFVEGVFVVGNTVYAATFGGLSTSTDGGATFTNKTTADGLGDNWVHKVFASGNSVYAATNGGLSISTDGGAAFTNTTTADGLGNNIVNAVAASGGIIYAGTNGGFSFGTGTQPADPTVIGGGSLTVTPSSGPVDNGTVANIEVHSVGTYTGTVSVNPTTGAVSLSDAAPVGTHTITIRATDNSGATTDATITLTVANVPPTVATPIPNQTATEDALFSFAFTTDTFADPADSLTFSASGVPSWLSFDAATRTFSGTPTNPNVGSVDITVTAKDSNNAEVSDTFTLTVANTNDPPTVANAIVDQSVTEGSPFSFTFAVNTFADVDVGDSLTYSNNGLPSWLNFNPATRTFSGTPSSAHVGSVSIDVIATDTSDASVTETFDLAVIGTQVVSTGGVVTITDVGGPSNDAVGITIDGDNLVVTLQGVAQPPIPLDDLTDLVINGGSGNDTLNLDLGDGPLPFNIVFNGGSGGFDTLNVTGFDDSGEFTAYTANYSNRNDGNVEFRDEDGILSTLTYTGLEPITIDGTPTEIIFNLPSTNDTDVRLLDIGGADGLMRLTGSTFETTDFSIAAATSITINANLGNDRVTIQSVDAGYSGQLIVHGGAGNDVLTATASPIAVTLRGDLGNDTLTGSANDDTLTGGTGNDSLNCGAGNDTVAETASQLKLTNTLLTGNGNDKLTSIERAILTGTATSNVLDASAFTLGNVTLNGGDGNDVLLGSAFTGATDDDDFNDSLDGGAGNDVVRQSSPTHQTLSAGPTGTTIATGAGSDLWTSIEGAHLIGCGNTATTLDASAFFGGVTLEGGAGHDTLIGGQGNNVLNGNAGNDSLTGGETADTLYGGAGNDTLDGRGGSDFLKGQAGSDTLLGGAGDDRLFGEAGNDRLFGGNGQDLMDGGVGSDLLTGEAGHDTINGGADNDAISGGNGDDVLNGGAGNDMVLGGDGADVLRSGGGSDRLSGGRGNDRFEANGAVIATGEGDDTVTGTNNRINEAFTFDFDRLLV